MGQQALAGTRWGRYVLGLETPAINLCQACGLCCNGVMFHTVRLQPRDSAKELAALGLKLKRKKGAHYIQQPCPAYREAQCSIYPARPERCRLFECRQLQRVAAGETTQALALATIREAQRRAALVDELLRQSGGTNPKRPLGKRCEKVLAEPPDDLPALELRSRLARAMQELNALLNAEFRLVPLERAEEGGPP